jgi:hypothetical protein
MPRSITASGATYEMRKCESRRSLAACHVVLVAAVGSADDGLGRGGRLFATFGP